MKRKKGQILVVVLLVVVIALAFGLSVASRNLTNLKTSTQAEQSQRAFTAAEGGVENTLSKLNNVATAIQSGSLGSSGCTSVSGNTATCPLGITPTGVDTTNSNVVVSANKSFERVVQLGDVAQVNLKGMVDGSQFTVKWSKKSNVKESTPKNATLEFTFVCDNSTSTFCAGDTITGTYGQHREAITVDSIIDQSGGFTTCGTSIGTLATTSTSDGNFNCTATFTIPGSSPTITNMLLLRIKPFWNSTTIRVESGAASFPVQTYNITSTAMTDSGLSRKVQVSRDAVPQLPAIFDYVLYSGGNITK